MEQSTQYATLEEFRKMLAPVAGKALGEAVRHLTIEKRVVGEIGKSNGTQPVVPRHGDLSVQV